MLPSNNLASLIGADVFDRDNEKIGTIAQIYTDPSTGQATWASVPSGLFGRGHTFVPLHSATADDNETVRLPFDAKFVKHAPHVDADSDGALTKADESTLLEYYGSVDRTDSTSTDERSTPEDSGSARELSGGEASAPSAGGTAYVIPDAGPDEHVVVVEHSDAETKHRAP